MSDRPLPSSFDDDPEFYEENRWQKFARRLKEEPLIPLGCGLTTWALINASRSIRAGDPQRTNRMFRARIYAQGFTILAMLAGSIYWKSDRQKRKEFDAAVAERKATEKRDAWIRELEIRDEEDKELRVLKDKRRGQGSPKDTAEKAAEKVKKAVKKPAGEAEEGKPDDGVAKSVIDEKEQGKGVLDSVQQLIWPKTK